MAEQITPQDPNHLPLEADDRDGFNTLSSWWSRVEASKELIDTLKSDWDKNVDNYQVVTTSGLQDGQVVVPKAYSRTETKKAALYFQTPQVVLEPMLPGLEGATPVYEAVLNHILGADGVNVKTAVDECLSDALIASGVFGVKIGYETTVDGTKQVQVGEQPDPNWQPTPEQVMAAQLGVAPMPQPPMIPQMADVPNIIAERYIFERISPVKILIPRDFKSSDYDKAPWLGFEFVMDFAVAQRAFNLPPDFKGFIGEDDRRLGKTDSQDRPSTKQIRGYEIYYKANVFDPNIKHPDHQRLLVLIEGLDEPAIHRDSPYQQFNPDGSISGMPGFPVHLGTLRTLPDSAYVTSDVGMGKFQVDELSQGRTQMNLQRRRSIPMRVAELAGVGGVEGLAKLEKNIYQGIIPLDSIDPMPIKEVPLAHFPQENFNFDNLANRDLDEVWGLGSNPGGSLNPTNRTATEIAVASNNSSTRLQKERGRLLDWFIRGVEKLGALIQMFADEPDYVQIVGDSGAKRLQQWDKTTIAGKYAFRIKPNTSDPVDLAQERQQFLQMYNLAANSPFVNRQELDAELLRKFDLDPARFAKKPEPPQPKPKDEPRVSVSIDENGLDPLQPAFPVVVEILRSQGVQISDQAVQAAQQHVAQFGMPPAQATPAQQQPPQGPPQGGGPSGPPQGPPQRPNGAATPVQPINKHATDVTGKRTGPEPGGFARLK